MSTLAQSFLADFEEEEEEEQQQQPQAQADKNASATSSSSPRVKSEGGAAESEDAEAAEKHATEKEDENDEEDEEDQEMEDNENADGETFDETSLPQPTADPIAPVFTLTSSSATLTSLLHSDKLKSHLSTIQEFQAKALAAQAAASISPLSGSTHGIDKEVEYPYIVYSNELCVEIDGHIASLHKLARDIYSQRYNELEQLLANPLDYARVASLLGNETDMTKIGKLLQNTGIANNVVLTISVTAATTRGKTLSEAELDKLKLVCTTILELEACKIKIHAYISSRMLAVAPNVSAMLGTDLSARIVALAGGVKKLSEIPACNIQVLGKKGKQSTGLSRISQGAHEGLIVGAPVLQSCPPSIKARALRLLAGKVTLAARLDQYTEDMDDSKGRAFLAEIEEKIRKWLEPPPTKLVKALPIPLQKSKPKRGGKRYRKEKEKMQITELAKQKNRMFFGKEEITDEYTGEGMGMIGQEGSGVLKVTQKDAKLAKRLSQKTQARLKRLGEAALNGMSSGVASSLHGVSGTASSIAFTQTQGMQLVKTQQIQRVKAANDNYFNATGTFAKVGVKRELPPVPTFGGPPPAAAASSSGEPAEKKQRTQ